MAKKRRKKKTGGVRRPPVQKRAPDQILDKGVPAGRRRRIKPAAVTGVLGLVLILGLAAYRLYFGGSRIIRDGGLNVLLVTLDTTRADRLGCYGHGRARTPNLDGRAAAGVRFENVTSQVPLTTPSHASILTGTYPLYHQVHNNGSYALPAEVTTLAEILKVRGFQTAAFVGSFTVDSRLGLDQGFDVYDDDLAEGQAFKPLNAERKAEKVYGAFRRWIDGGIKTPFFCWVHFYDPHLPYEPPAPYSVDFADSPYDGEISYMDHYVGQVLAALREKNLLARTLVVLAGDHGEAFGEKAEAGHGVFLYDGTLKVPLIFEAEGHLPKGTVIKSRVRLIDIVPSVLDLLGLPIPGEIQGTSLLPTIAGREKKDLSSYLETYFPRENYGWSELVGLVDGDWKYIKAPKPELYNLKADPQETQNVFGREARNAELLRQRLTEITARYSSGLPASKRELTSEEREKLRSLGYVDQTAGAPSGPLPDPKDMVQELRMNQEAETLEMAGRLAEAARAYGQILDLNPRSPVNYVNLALVEAKMNEFDEAVRILERGISALPGSITLLSRLAHTYMVMGRLQKSLDAWQAVLVIDPEYFDGLLASGWILDLMGKKEEARGFFEKALAVEPENRFLRKNYALNLATTGNLKEAIGVYERLRQDFPDDYEVLQDMGIAYGYAGEINKAIDVLKAAVEIHPTPVAYYNLTVALKRVGDIKDAVYYLKLYLGNPEGEDEAKVMGARQELLVLEKLLQ